MRAVATADAPSSSSAAGSRTQAACRIELRFIALGALESKGGVATPGPSIRPARFFGKGNRLGLRCSPKPVRTARLGGVMPKEVPLTGCGVQHASSIVVEKLPRTDALSKNFLNALYWTVSLHFMGDSTALRLAQQRPIHSDIAACAVLSRRTHDVSPVWRRERTPIDFGFGQGQLLACKLLD